MHTHRVVFEEKWRSAGTRGIIIYTCTSACGVLAAAGAAAADAPIVVSSPKFLSVSRRLAGAAGNRGAAAAAERVNAV